MSKTSKIKKIIFISIIFAIMLFDCKAFAIQDKPKEAQPTSVEGNIQKEIKTETPLQGWLRQDNLTGEWNGLRPWLEKRGITIEGEYITESFVKAKGGSSNRNNVNGFGKILTSVTIDTKKAGLWGGGTAFVSFENLHGSGLSNRDIGDIQVISNIDANPYSQLNEYYYEQNLLHNILTIKAGRQEANADFCALESASDFIHSSYGLVPNAPIPTYPAPAMGVASSIAINDNTKLMYGIYDGDAKESTSGVRTAFDGKGGAVHVAEISYNSNINNYQGRYIAGYWYHTGDFEEITSRSNPTIYKDNKGFYGGFEQIVYIENEQDNQGLNLIGQYGWAPSNKSEISKYYGLALTYKGLLPNRNEDLTGIGTAFADLSNRYKDIDGRTIETALEVYHKFQITPWLALQPDMQLVFNPNGNNKNALVFGIRSILRL